MKLQVTKPVRPTQKVIDEFARVGNSYLEDFEDTVGRVRVCRYDDRYAEVVVYGRKGWNAFLILSPNQYGEWGIDGADII